MAQNEQMHRQLIANCLARMGVDAAVTSLDALQEGISGSHTYHLRLDAEPAVLKVTLAGRQPYILKRAQREYQFYHALVERVPLQVPRVLASHAADDFGVCLLLAAYRPADPAEAWEKRDYLQVAAQLAGLHATFWGQANELTTYPWLREPDLETEAGQIQAARDAWRELFGQERFRSVLAEGALPALYGALERIPAIDALLCAFPRTLCHGNCHIGNLLRDRQGGLVWADWQEVGIGCGPEDLAFLFQRAFPSGTGSDALVGPVVAAYQARLEADTGEQIPLAGIQRVMDGSELRTRLLHWPFYLGGAPVEVVASMLARIEVLVDRTQPGGAGA